MNIKRYVLGSLQTNCYLLMHDGMAILIDPADDAVFLMEELYREKVALLAMIATHGHFDHIMAVGQIQMMFNKYENAEIPFYLHKDDIFLAKRFGETAKHFLGYDPKSIPPETVTYLEPGTLHISPFTFEVKRTPGHTPGSCSLYMDDASILFPGDVVFKHGVGRYDFEYCSKSDLQHSIETLCLLPDDTVIYPGHGDETTIEEVKRDFHQYF